MVRIPEVRRGDVWWYEPPGLKRRPVVILTRNSVLTLLNQIIAAPATRTIRSIPTEVPLDEADGMPAECVVTLDNVLAVRPPFLTGRITTLSSVRMREVCTALRIAVAC